MATGNRPSQLEAGTNAVYLTTNTGTVVDNQNPLEVQTTVNVESDSGCPTISKYFNFDFSDSSVSVTSSYTTMYSYTGSGKLHGFVLDYNSDRVRTKLTIDGSCVVFELTNDQIESIQSFNGNGCDDDDGSSGMMGGFIRKTAGNKLTVEFKCPIKYDTSVLIEAQRTSSSNKALNTRLVFIEKVT